MNPALYSTVWVALALFAVAEAGKRQYVHRRPVPDWAWAAWLSAAGLCTLHMALAFATRYGWSQEAAVRETARQTAAVYGVTWGGGVYVNYVLLSAWFTEAWWWRMYPAHYFGRHRAITWALRGFYFLIIFNAAIVFASALGRAMGLVLVGALVWIWSSDIIAGPASR